MTRKIIGVVAALLAIATFANAEGMGDKIKKEATKMAAEAKDAATDTAKAAEGNVSKEANTTAAEAAEKFAQ